ncbi:hypothetical protein BO78DRAFT_22646 [Aspergillus sclerotiicarbonarius CBS 121057]|uniref:CDR ABC transporter domain-containing protein n=1 Tax=Aspergillus sclerotiicarbonarius (strain CBS 121057 / IBT 28362) TaxID=1448318 RepID=A0A319EQA0_ASPSB|nr:hypothetical protein BO78DRAFT_22646 [Aspergillus sclerotiicarbonarius CBS 121057]
MRWANACTVHMLNQYTFSYSHRSRNVGIFIGFIVLNYMIVGLVTYLVFVVKWRG